jgi:hypothetical protein
MHQRKPLLYNDGLHSISQQAPLKFDISGKLGGTWSFRVRIQKMRQVEDILARPSSSRVENILFVAKFAEFRGDSLQSRIYITQQNKPLRTVLLDCMHYTTSTPLSFHSTGTWTNTAVTSERLKYYQFSYLISVGILK